MIYLREAIAGLISPWVVSSHERFSRQLLQFAHTELYTSFDIATMAARQPSPLREELERHARDERRHYGVFRAWAKQVSPYVGANYGDPDDPGGLDEASVRWAATQPAAPHRRLQTRFEYMAYLFLSESRAVLQFKLYQWLNAYDERCRKQIPLLLADETRHVRYSLRHAWAEFRAAPVASSRGLLRVFGYILRQDVVDLLKLVQTLGSGVMSALLYYGVITPYACGLRLLGGARRARLRTARAAGARTLDEGFWREA